MIHRDQPKLIYIDDLFHRLHQAEAKHFLGSTPIHVGPRAHTRAAGFARRGCRASLDWAGEGTRPYMVRGLTNFSNRIPINLHPLGGARDIALSRPNPMSNHACAQNV